MKKLRGVVSHRPQRDPNRKELADAVSFNSLDNQARSFEPKPQTVEAIKQMTRDSFINERSFLTVFYRCLLL
jgi:hypothetical protein